MSSDQSTASTVILPFWLYAGPFVQFPFDEGVRIENWDSRTFAFVTLRGPLNDFPPPGFAIHIMSPKLQEVISAAAPGAIQFLPIGIRSWVGEEIAHGFAVANYLIWCKAVDAKRSVPWAGMQKVIKHKGYYLLSKLVLNAKKIDAPIFRVTGLENVHVYREDVVERINAMGATGVVFEPIES
ncbi:MAG TPA: DUF1629 domain-containing protein [Planctomycetaceae bacterium]|nr:DUF1629 domain-containing protein [Planctomycetaceae bacterium]